MLFLFDVHVAVLVCSINHVYVLRVTEYTSSSLSLLQAAVSMELRGEFNLCTHLGEGVRESGISQLHTQSVYTSCFSFEFVLHVRVYLTKE